MHACSLAQLCPTLCNLMDYRVLCRVCQAPLSMEFSRQKCWSGLPFPPPGNLPNPGIEPAPLMSPALAGGVLTTSTMQCLYTVEIPIIKLGAFSFLQCFHISAVFFIFLFLLILLFLLLSLPLLFPLLLLLLLLLLPLPYVWGTCFPNLQYQIKTFCPEFKSITF